MSETRISPEVLRWWNSASSQVSTRARWRETRCAQDRRLRLWRREFRDVSSAATAGRKAMTVLWRYIRGREPVQRECGGGCRRVTRPIGSALVLHVPYDVNGARVTVPACPGQ